MRFAASSSSSCKKHEVFLSFRGEDTRRSFTSHLHNALCREGIEAFIDNELPKGDDISQSLIEAIHNSSISVIVFSENYATSKWCLKELIHILLCKEKQGQHVVPIFYKVDPSHVRNQKGTYEEAFAEHLKTNPEKVDEWRKALFETASLSGWSSCNFRDEVELIQNIVNDIIKKLNLGPSSAPVDIVGIEENCDNIESMLQEFSSIGIWGMGGIGKTTMAKVVYSKIRSQFDICFFLDNFRENAGKHWKEYIHEKLFRELAKDTSLKGHCRKKVLIVLDDVSETSHLDYLENEIPTLGHGSKVIITSRDKHVLNGRFEKIHKAKALGESNSRELFNMKAFRKGGYKSEYGDLVERALSYAQGNPLALTTLGSFLYSKTADEWESALGRLEKTIDPKIQAVLELSYDGLVYEDKRILLDIAFFWKGASREYVITMLKSCGFHASIGLRNLADKALISIDEASDRPMVEMHDLIQSMAFEVVRQECMDIPGRRSRLCDPDEIYDVLRNDEGTDTIEGISLDLSQIRDLQLPADTFRKMTKLRILKFYSPWRRKSCTVHLPSGLRTFSSSLRYLQWDNFPSKSLSLSPFCAETLVELKMPNSHLKRLWDGVQNLVYLRQINLAQSKQLIELPDLCRAQNLEVLDVQECKSLSHIDPHIFSLPRLESVYLYHCTKLKSVKANRESESLTTLGVGGCSGLKELSFSSKKMIEFRLNYDESDCYDDDYDYDVERVQVLDFSLGSMEKLEELSLNCSPLTTLPINDICCMRSLAELTLHNCGGLIDTSKLHTLFDALLSLTEICLHGACKLSELPKNIKHLSRLYYLIIINCKSLQSLPELPSSIVYLEVYGCTSLKKLHFTSSLLEDEITLGPVLCSSVGHLRNLYRLYLWDCEQLYELPESIGSLSSLDTLDLRGSNVERLPDSIKHLSNLQLMNLSNCRRLRSLPDFPPCINLIANDCISLENHSLSRVAENVHHSLKLLMYTQRIGYVCYPGRKAPKWFSSDQVTNASNYVTMELHSTPNNLIGFILCSVLSHNSNDVYKSLKCQVWCDEIQRGSASFEMTGTTFDSHHVFLWCLHVPPFHSMVDDQNPNYKPNISFEFSLEADAKVVDDVIEAYGVCPVYASEYPNFIQSMELESNMGTQRGTCHDAEENSVHG